MKTGGWSGTLLVAALFLCPDASAQTVGAIQMEKALMATAEMKQAIEDLALQLEPRRKLLAERRRKAYELLKELQSACVALGDRSAFDRLDTVIREANRLESEIESAEKSQLYSYSEPVRRRMLAILRSVAEARGLVLVMDAKAAYIADALDITDEVIAAYNKVHKVY